MRITQAYISPSVSDFPFLKCLGLEEYHDVSAPAVFFGCYTMVDLMKIVNHQGLAVIRWCGQDAFDFRHWHMIRHCHHVSPLAKVREWIGESSGRHCCWIPPENLNMEMNPTPKGSKVYAYVPASFPEYHGIDIIKNLSIDYEIIFGDGAYSRDKWYGGIADRYYDESFVGLMLSPFAGGGQSVLDMGLRGRKCITNVIPMPNAIPWSSIKDIEQAIKKEALGIGQTNRELTERVFNAIDKDYEWLNTECYE